MNTKIITLIFTLSILCTCASAPNIKGSWIDTRMPDPPIKRQGIYLGKDGKAASINAENKAYKTWELKGRKLTLSGIEVKDNQITNFNEVYKIKTIKNGIMTLENDGKKIQYIKDNSANYKINQ